MKKVHWIMVAWFISAMVMAEPAAELYPFETKAQSSQFHHMLSSLRCLVCQNQNLEDSHAPLAKDLKEKVYELVKEGRSDDEIMHFMTDRYGDFVLFNPPVKWLTYLLWFGPLLFVISGLFVFLQSCQRKEVN
ncbi:cytochrome c-type biogenesis protein CcmH [Legionella sp. W05-934-2]|jgi:cytochrome c-type biogenesis protein CcmH|uniref:cytochrome c-type biogenesis protein n=1 Tax=Legionella sp. W05-934-2 TaxID=1198649 RepID=UPI0034637496